MAGYPKIWTTIRHEPWFRPLKPVQKCIWYEVLLIAKEQTDDGWVCFANTTSMAGEIGCDRASVGTWLERECGHGRVSDVEKSSRMLRFYLTNYKDNQGVTKYQPGKKGAPKQSKQSKQSKQGQEDVNTEPGTSTPEPNHGLRQAFFKRFNKDLSILDSNRLLEVYKDPGLLDFMITHITIGDVKKITSPVGLLITARAAPGSHLRDQDYDQWKLLQRQIAGRR